MTRVSMLFVMFIVSLSLVITACISVSSQDKVPPLEAIRNALVALTMIVSLNGFVIASFLKEIADNTKN